MCPELQFPWPRPIDPSSAKSLTPLPQPRMQREDTGTDADSPGGGSCTSPEDNEIEPILETFLAMEPRRLRRVRYSRVPRRSLGNHVTGAVQTLIILMLVANLFHISFSSLGLQRFWAIPWLASVTLVGITIFQTITTPEHTFTAWIATEVYIFCLWTAWWFRELSPHDTDRCVRIGRVCIQEELINLATIFAILIIVTCLMYLLRHLLRTCVPHSRTWALWWYSIRPVTTRPGLTCFSYKPSGMIGWTRAEFMYSGNRDEDGRPHGHGRWCDTSFHGECLRGMWVHGRPVGTFTSRESGTGAQFLQRPVAYATSRADCPAGNIGAFSMMPVKLAWMRYGHAQVEVSFAGGFFPFLPSIEQHYCERAVEDLVRALCPAGNEQRRGARPTVKLEVVTAGELAAWREEDLPSTMKEVQIPVHFSEGDHMGYVTPEGLFQAQSLAGHTEQEALVFIHGYNCPLSTALGRVAQLFALGNMSPHIVPFVFSYSAGGTLQYFSVKQHMPAYGEDLNSFLEELGRHFQEVHILTHSCGAEFFFANWAAIQGRFLPAVRLSNRAAPWQGAKRWVSHGGRRAEGDTRMHLATLTLMNPDVLVESVVKTLPSMMEAAEHFTTYNDANDGALFFSTWLQKLVPRWYQKRPRAQGETVVFGKQLRTLWHERCGSDPNDTGLRGELVGETTTERPSRGGSDLEAQWHFPQIPGDGVIDIINCSSIDQNVHKLRHNYYMLNTQMVEDVCELIGSRLTAPFRQRLTQVNGNIFNFLSPPSHLKE